MGHKCASELRDILQLAVQSSAKIAQPSSSGSPGQSLRQSELPGPSLEVQVSLHASEHAHYIVCSLGLKWPAASGSLWVIANSFQFGIF